MHVPITSVAQLVRDNETSGTFGSDKYGMGTDVVLLGKELTCNYLSLWIISVKTSTASA